MKKLDAGCQAKIGSVSGSVLQQTPPKHSAIDVGVVIRKAPGVTRWAKWSWKVVGVLPGAAPANWKLLREDGGAFDYHAATLPMMLYRTDTEAYVHALEAETPGLFVIMRPRHRSAREVSASEDSASENAASENAACPMTVALVTASAYEAQDYTDSAEDMVEKIAMPPALLDWVRSFVDTHHEDEVFIKRKRDKHRQELVEDGKGDHRIRQASDVFRAPRKREMLQ